MFYNPKTQEEFDQLLLHLKEQEFEIDDEDDNHIDGYCCIADDRGIQYKPITIIKPK